VAKQGETWREMTVNFAGEVSLSYSAGALTSRKTYGMGPTASLPPEGSPATDFYRPCLGLNPRAMGPVANTITTIPPRTTFIQPACATHIFNYHSSTKLSVRFELQTLPLSSVVKCTLASALFCHMTSVLFLNT
jgi:hypothetical protein